MSTLDLEARSMPIGFGKRSHRSNNGLPLAARSRGKAQCGRPPMRRMLHMRISTTIQATLINRTCAKHLLRFLMYYKLMIMICMPFSPFNICSHSLIAYLFLIYLLFQFRRVRFISGPHAVLEYVQEHWQNRHRDVSPFPAPYNFRDFAPCKQRYGPFYYNRDRVAFR